MAARSGRVRGHDPEAELGHAILDALGLGYEQTMRRVFEETLAFEDLERWIVEVTGGVDPDRVARINAAVAGEPPPASTRALLEAIERLPPVLSEEDLAFWDEHGYVVVKDAIPSESRDAAARAIYEHLGATPDDPATWNVRGPTVQGIMVQLFQHPALEANRRSLRLHKAFAQIWATPDLWCTTDRVSFNPPESSGRSFQGPHLHWDVSLATPIPLGTQGLVYLSDTPDDQGALTMVPGFHREIEAWLASLPPGAQPREQDLSSRARPVGGRAGDLVIWHQALPHGASPNRAAFPRLVQYVNMRPLSMKVAETWI